MQAVMRRHARLAPSPAKGCEGFAGQRRQHQRQPCRWSRSSLASGQRSRPKMTFKVALFDRIRSTTPRSKCRAPPVRPRPRSRRSQRPAHHSADHLNEQRNHRFDFVERFKCRALARFSVCGGGRNFAVCAGIIPREVDEPLDHPSGGSRCSRSKASLLDPDLLVERLPAPSR